MASTSDVTLEDLELVDAPSTTADSVGDGSMDIDTHLSYPTYTIEEQRELLRQYDAQQDDQATSQPVKALLKDSRVDPAADNCSALQLAAKNRHTAVVKLLIEDGRSNQDVMQVDLHNHDNCVYKHIPIQ